MRAVVMLAIVGLIALVLAVLTGSTPLAVVVIALAVAGIVQLVRDWHREPSAEQPDDTETAALVIDQPSGKPELSADEFTPDISTDPDGPSSDARADQR